MDLKEFVKQTLCQIIDGVKEAQLDESAASGQVSPDLNRAGSHDKHGFMLSDRGRLVQIVQFDVALTVTEGTGTKGGIGVFSGAINLGSSGQSSAENKSVSHVKFCVPLVLPKREDEHG